ncbi:hypothetical protein HII31_00082 [Pseudocercospora fuligena]|uniref:Uncharacterized protein n=1 Tax=Pseudocercospora fuligena TaxID=685502 RepID=A0A8H6VN11_9PEZI|nr:hypothetical protein HII31_00082 [Pseudocercospora fuligena]
MSSNNTLLLSEGTCYFGAGQQSDSHFIPCGNANLEGPQSCCYEGDFCLSSNTCWDNDTVVTYVAGCTDSTYRASSCPQRYTYPDQQWVALARCDGADQDLWTGCAHHPDLIEIEKESCTCNKSNVLIQNPNGKGSFDEIGQLPSATGLTIDYNPTAVPTATEAASSGGGGLSTGAKAGIGVGVGIGGLLIIAGAVFLFLMMRRRKSAKPDNEKSELPGGGYYANEKKGELSGDYHRGASVDTTGRKSELSPDGQINELENNNNYNGTINRGSTNLSEMGPNTPHPGR